MPRLVRSFENKLLFLVAGKAAPTMTVQYACKIYGQQVIQLSDLYEMEQLVLKGQLTDELALSDRSLEHAYINALITQRAPDRALSLRDGIERVSNCHLRENLRYLFGMPGYLKQINDAFDTGRFAYLEKAATVEVFKFLYMDDYYKFEEITQQLRDDQLNSLYDMLRQKNDWFLKELVDAYLLGLAKPPLLLLLQNATADDCYFDVLLQKILQNKDKCFQQKEQFYNCFLNISARNHTSKATKLKFYATTFFRRLFYTDKKVSMYLRPATFYNKNEQRYTSNILQDWLIQQDNVDFGIFQSQ